MTWEVDNFVNRYQNDTNGPNPQTKCSIWFVWPTCLILRTKCIILVNAFSLFAWLDWLVSIKHVKPYPSAKIANKSEQLKLFSDVNAEKKKCFPLEIKTKRQGTNSTNSNKLNPFTTNNSRYQTKTSEWRLYPKTFCSFYVHRHFMFIQFGFIENAPKIHVHCWIKMNFIRMLLVELHSLRL